MFRNKVLAQIYRASKKNKIKEIFDPKLAQTSLDAQRAKNVLTNYAHLYRAEIDSKALVLPKFLANGHITLNTPVLVRSPKLSNVEPSQYLDG